MNVIDHLGFGVSDFHAALAFYEKALSPLGISVVMKLDPEETGGYEGAGLGRGGKPSLWLAPGGKTSPRLHVAFVADDRAAVDAFYDAAIAAGARDNGRPGVRAEYHPNYYGAFVLDPDGHNIEAVCHKPA